MIIIILYVHFVIEKYFYIKLYIIIKNISTVKFSSLKQIEISELIDVLIINNMLFIYLFEDCLQLTAEPFSETHCRKVLLLLTRNLFR